MKKKELINSLVSFLDGSKSMYHAADLVAKELDKNGFEQVFANKKWDLKKGKGYYTIVNDSGLVAFRVGEDKVQDTGFKIIGAHLDSPTFRIKPNPVIKDKEILKLNTETYGGTILSTWFDRPLSIAGRVMVENGDKLEMKLVDLEKPIAIIPNVAIHMNREVNNGFVYKTNLHTLPILLVEGDENILNKLVAKKIGVKPEQLIAMDLYVYDYQKAVLMGEDEGYISSGRLDNLAMSHTALHALLNTDNKKETQVIVLSDNEEVGSMSIQGANSTLIPTVLKRIVLSQGGNEEDYHVALGNSFMISSDMAHAYHPNFSDLADTTNKVFLNKGPVIKEAANRAYTSDAYSKSRFMKICKEAEIPVQEYVNPSHIRGGSTIGPISEAMVQVKAVDVGNPVWAMHSTREFGGVEDHFYMYKAMLQFFK